jgi:hypothetical protein
MRIKARRIHPPHIRPRGYALQFLKENIFLINPVEFYKMH